MCALTLENAAWVSWNDEQLKGKTWFSLPFISFTFPRIYSLGLQTSPPPSRGRWGAPWATVLCDGKKWAVILCSASWWIGLSSPKHQESRFIRSMDLGCRMSVLPQVHAHVCGGGGWGGGRVCVGGYVAEEDWGVFWTSLIHSALFPKCFNTLVVGLCKLLS